MASASSSVESKPKVISVSFHVTGEFLTQHARALWADENRPDFALRTLMLSLDGMTEDQALLVCSGSRKLVGDSKNGVDMVEDAATKSPNGNTLLSMEGILARLVRHNQRLHDDIYDVSNPTCVPSPRGLVKIGPHALKRIRDRKSDWDSEPLQHVGSLLDRPTRFPPEEAPSGAYKEAIEHYKRKSPLVTTVAGQSLLDRFMAQVKTNDEEADKPLTKDLEFKSKNGWVDRAGDFWPCNYMGHIALAERLGEKEVRLEDQGWLKISDSQDPMCFGDRESDVLGTQHKSKYTEAQKSSILTWCVKHSRKFPKWLTDDE